MRRRAVFPLLAAVALVVASACRRAPELPDLGAVPEFAVRDSAGRPVTHETFRGRVWAAAFVFTRCPVACPRVTAAMRDLQARAAASSVALDLVSFTVDPEYDTPEVLRAYAERYAADLRSWSFLTGDAAAIQRAAEQGFKIAVEGRADPAKADFGLQHGTQLVLVDPALRLRGYYATSDPEALLRLLEDARHLAR